MVLSHERPFGAKEDEILRYELIDTISTIALKWILVSRINKKELIYNQCLEHILSHLRNIANYNQKYRTIIIIRGLNLNQRVRNQPQYSSDIFIVNKYQPCIYEYCPAIVLTHYPPKWIHWGCMGPRPVMQTPRDFEIPAFTTCNNTLERRISVSEYNGAHTYKF